MASRRSLAEHPITRGTTRAFKLTAGVLSAGAAAISIIGFARSHGWLDAPTPAVAPVPVSSAAFWLGVWPETDTARAVGDTIQLTAALKDAHGALIPGATVAWSSDDPSIVSVDDAGAAVTRRQGSVSIVAAAGGKISRSRIVVAPRVSSIEIGFDSTFRIPEGQNRLATVRPLDARGHLVAGAARPTWATGDGAILVVDSAGAVTARTPGRSTLEARVESITARIEVEVVPVPGSMVVMQGAGQRADAGAPLSQPIVVQVYSRGGKPLGGVPVRFATEPGAGTTSAQTDLTDAQGKAHTSWNLGGIPGWQRLTASISGLDSQVVIRAEADPVPQNTKVSLAADPGTGIAGDSLPSAVSIRVTDSLGTALADLPVAWTALDGGKITGLSARTDSMGEARAVWSLGPKVGKQRARAQVGNPRRLPVFAISASAAHGPAALAEVTAGNGQKGVVGGALAHSVLVRVTDRNGNRVPGAALVLRPDAGVVTDSTITADENGVAQFHWTLGHSSGPQHFKVHIEGIDKPIVLDAFAWPEKAARVAFAPLPATTAKPLFRPVHVTVSDQYGNPLKGQDVWLTPRAGRVVPAHAVTDARGSVSAEWALSSRSAAQSLVASLKGGKIRDSVGLRIVAPRPVAPKPTVAAKPVPAPRTSGAPTILH
jgi:hypothetical protein